jgi:drug/metabolite transporter (DMT)-like permease
MVAAALGGAGAGRVSRSARSWRSRSPTRGSRSSFAHDLTFGGDDRALFTGGALVFASALSYAVYLVGAGDVIARLGSVRFTAWAMLASCVFVFAQFALTRDLSALAVPRSIYALSVAMAVFSTVVPTWLIAEAVRRLGANTSSLMGSLGPVFTIGFGAMILGEAVHWVPARRRRAGAGRRHARHAAARRRTASRREGNGRNDP